MMDPLNALAPGDSPVHPLEAAPDDGLLAAAVPAEPPSLPLLTDFDNDLPWTPAGGWWLLGSDGE